MTPSLAGAGQARLLLIALCVTAFLDGLDISIVNVALPQIQQQLGFSTDLLGWVISAYAITYGGFVLLGGRTADQFGRRRMFLLALGLFCFANLLGGLAQTPAQLLVARFLMGLAAAFNGPAALSLLTTVFPEGSARTRALGVFSSMAASGFTAGLILGGLLSSLEWRLIFLLPAGVALLALIVSWLVVPKQEANTAEHIDFLGAFAITAAAVLISAAFARLSHGQADAICLLMVLASVTAFLLFRWCESRAPFPMIPPGLLTQPGMRQAGLVALTFLASGVSMQFVTTLYWQEHLHLSPLQIGLAYLPFGLLAVGVAQQAGKTLPWLGIRACLIWGSISVIAGTLLLTLTVPMASPLPLQLLAMVLLGIGHGLCVPAIFTGATAGVSAERQGVASGVINSALQLGAGVGLVLTTLAMAVFPHSVEPLFTFQVGLSAAALLACCGLGFVLGVQ